MMDLKEDIKGLMVGAENAEVEFKSAKGGLPESFWESFSSFANTNANASSKEQIKQDVEDQNRTSRPKFVPSCPKLVPSWSNNI